VNAHAQRRRKGGKSTPWCFCLIAVARSRETARYRSAAGKNGEPRTLPLAVQAGRNGGELPLLFPRAMAERKEKKPTFASTTSGISLSSYPEGGEKGKKIKVCLQYPGQGEWREKGDRRVARMNASIFRDRIGRKRGGDKEFCMHGDRGGKRRPDLHGAERSRNLALPKEIMGGNEEKGAGPTSNGAYLTGGEEWGGATSPTSAWGEEKGNRH